MSLELHDCSATYLLPMLATHDRKLEHFKVDVLVGFPLNGCPVARLSRLQSLSIEWVATP
jgi:hypothetical protein